MQEPDPLLQPTPILNYTAPAIQALINQRGWRDLPRFERIGAAYTFVRDEIAFGYNATDDIPASQVLAEGIGQCNTKASLLMALLRGLGIACRLHGFTIHKALQRGVVPPLVYPITPDSILHSWVELQHEGQWVNLEGFILDTEFLARLQAGFEATPALCGYGAGTDCLADPGIDWSGQSTYIQREGINHDFGTFDSPDAFYADHQQAFSWWKGLLYRRLIRHWMNARVRGFRSGRRRPRPLPPHSHPRTVQE
ncbi:MAG TPA: transglutaminase family protein [Aliiroseovarius sp.]|nr:transglutaminase family protein [Aliiroseovarius sp.]